jgi:hypothetical protein
MPALSSGEFGNRTGTCMVSCKICADQAGCESVFVLSTPITMNI